MEDRLSYKLDKHGRRIYGTKKVELLYTSRQAAKYCGATVGTILRWVDFGILKAYREMKDENTPASETKGRYFFTKSDLDIALRVGLGVPTKGFNVEDKT